ncbi:universal stress protein [Muriicola sp. Z0-33]|uniref:universal stress protein n=1 Tax=Muriicola sp. Z0-33 TaxID=2816957 RepID=UPI0022370AA2|nr:universal stress protein [Muriicola sp. Z0-33]MCW5515772.1 universal stress protein [Muriicola sp. Z0-33]
MKQILLLTDFSDNAWNAIYTARKLYGGQPCHFIILNCYVPKLENVSGFKSSARSGVVVSGLKKTSEEGLKEVESELKRQASDKQHTYTTISSNEDLISQIVKLIPEYDLDLIVMGAKGASASSHIFMGSNTVAVIRKVRNCAVLSVPENFNFQSLKQVVFPTDYTHFCAKGKLRVLLEMLRHWDSAIQVVHFGREFILSDAQKANKKVLEERLEHYNCNHDRAEMAATLSETITKYAEEKMADMICLVHYKHTFLEQLTQEPAIKKVVFNTSIPLLVLPD